MTNLIEDTTQVSKPYLTILYQDEYLVVIDKPAGLFVHRSFMDKYEQYFAVQLLRDQLGQYVYPVHRLDKPTSGVLIFALSKQVARLLGQQFSEHTINKTYFALVRGHLLSNGLIDYPLQEKLDKLGDKFVAADKPAQSAQSYYQSVANATLPVSVGKYPTARYSLIKLTPKTGRRHQLRRHLAHLRHPIIGDINYGDNKQNPFFIDFFGFKRLMLLAKSISFYHPIAQHTLTISVVFDEQWQTVFNQLGWSVDALETLS